MKLCAIDVHHHYVPEYLLEEAKKRGAHLGVELVEKNGQRSLSFAGGGGNSVAAGGGGGTTGGGLIRDGFDATLDDFRGLERDSNAWLVNYQKDLIEQTKIASLKVGFNQVFGYYIEITKAHQQSVPGDYERRQTLTGAERYVTPQLKEYEARVLNAEERSVARERELLDELCRQVSDRIGRIQGTARLLAELDVLAGLAKPQKELPPKYFYDARGSALFEAICELPEYYLTRTEAAIMHGRGAEMARHLGPGCALIEFGSGSARKTRILIEAAAPAAYLAIDIARDQLEATAADLARDFPRLEVIAICADYSRPIALPQPAAPGSRRRVIYFPGSTIGNLVPAEARAFLRNAASLAGAGGGLLIGVDLKKDTTRLNAAYNDARGVTAEFNLNLLARINRELGAAFDLSAFRHFAFYNEALGRIEMHLVSTKAQAVTIGGGVFRFRGDETIHTENSYKYSIAEFQELGSGAGLVPVECWTDPERLFAVHYMGVRR